MSGKSNLDIRPGLSMVLRAALEHMQGLLRADPWLPVPQSGCTYSFGYRKKPLPIGALWRIIERAPGFGGQCPNCKGFLMPFVFGGDEFRGGVKTCCIDCCRVFYQSMGDLDEVSNAVAPVLAGTPFAIAEVIDDNYMIGPREPLWRALKDRGVVNLPDESWIDGRDPSESWSRTAAGRAEEQACNALTPTAASRLDRFWHKVRRHTPRTPPWLCRPIHSSVPLRKLGEFEPLLFWGFQEPRAPNVGVAGLVQVPGATEVALWFSRINPYHERDAIHAVIPPLVASDPEALRDVLLAAFSRTLPRGDTIIDVIPDFVRPYTAGGALDHGDWSLILRGSPGLADGSALLDRVNDVERAQGVAMEAWRLGQLRMSEKAFEPPREPLSPLGIVYCYWWGHVSTTETAESYMACTEIMWGPREHTACGRTRVKVPSKRMVPFLNYLDAALSRDEARAKRDAWLRHTFPTNWYFDRGLPPVSLPVRVSRLAGGVRPEDLPMRALFDDFVDWNNETKSSASVSAEVLDRLGALADEEGDGDGPGPLGTLECPHCGRRRMVTQEFLESAGIDLEELPRRALRIGCCRCQGKGAIWSGRLS